VTIIFGRWVVAAVRFGKICRDSVPAGDADVASQFRELATEIGVRRVPKLRTHPQLAVPMAGGILRHRIILPADCANWPEEDRRMTLLHELIHVRRRDALFHLLASVTKALHWANPFAWIAVRSMRTAAERATDDRVLESGAAVPDYARLLVEFASRQMAEISPSTPAAASAMAQPHTVESRVRRILDPGQRRARPQRFAVASLAACFAMLLVGVGGPALADDKSKDKKSTAASEVSATDWKPATKKKLHEVIIEHVDFTEATLEEAVEYCVAKCEEQGQTMNIIVSPYISSDPTAPAGEAKRPTISLQMRDIPVGELLHYMALLTGTTLHIEPHSLVFRTSEPRTHITETYPVSAEVMKQIIMTDEEAKEANAVADADPFGDGGGGSPFGGEEPEAVPDREPKPYSAQNWLQGAGIHFGEGQSAHYEWVGEILIVRNTRENLDAVEAILASMGAGGQPDQDSRNRLVKKVQTKVVENIEFVEATLEEAVAYLYSLTGDDPINLLVIPTHAEQNPITFKLRNIPFASALDYVSEFSNYTYRIDSNAIVMTPTSEPDRSFFIRTIPVSSENLHERLAGPSAISNWAESLGILRYQENMLYYDPVGKNIIVRHTKQSIKVIEDTVRRLNESGEK